MLAEVDERPALVGKLELDPADLAGIVAAGLLPQLVPQAYLALPESWQNKLKGKVECIWTPVGRAIVNVTLAESS